jgi:hypothetical protein
MKKIGWFCLMAGLGFALIWTSCMSWTAIKNVPQGSNEPTQFEGAWSGVIPGSHFGSAFTQIQFKGNEFVMTRGDNWFKGIFTHDRNRMFFYFLYHYSPQRKLNQFRWLTPEESLKPGFVEDWKIKYLFNQDELVLEKGQLHKMENALKAPEDYAIFSNENNFFDSGPGLFTITAIDDQEYRYSNFAGGYYPAAMRDPGIHKVSFRQSFTEGFTYEGNTVTRTIRTFDGYFTKEFIPGGYRFFLSRENDDSLKDAPPVPPGSIRIIINRTEIGFSEHFYDYVDIQLN